MKRRILAMIYWRSILMLTCLVIYSLGSNLVVVSASAQSNVELVQRLNQLQFQVDQILAAISNNPDGSAVVRLPEPRGSVQQSETNFNPTILLRRMQETESALLQITNRLELIENTIRQLEKQLTEATAQRLADPVNPVAETDLPVAADSGATQPVASEAPPETNTGITLRQVELPKITTPALTDALTGEAAIIQDDIIALSVTDLYDHSIAALNREEYDIARDGLETLLTKYPDDALASNAYYWLGEIHYKNSEYAEAASKFMQGFQDFPEGNKAPDSLLKLGMSLKALDKLDIACDAFLKVAEFNDAGANAVRDTAKREASANNCNQN